MKIQTSIQTNKENQRVQRRSDQQPTGNLMSLRSGPGARSAQVFRRSESACACDGGCPKCLPQTEPSSQPARVTYNSANCGQEHKQPGQLEAALGNNSTMNKIRSLQGKGQPLPASDRSFFESRLGADFSGVRVHTGTAASETAKDIHAQAYTYGKDIVFAEQHYSPATEDGKNLLAHELTHVMQQNRDCTLASGAAAATISNTQFLARQVDPDEEENDNPFPPTVFTPGVAHHHQPTDCWSEVEEASSCWNGPIECACSLAGSPRGVLMLAYLHELDDLAREHLTHYVQGSGDDFPEDLEYVVRNDEGFRSAIAAAIDQQGDQGWLKIEQTYYSVEDFKNSFGAIDHLDFEVNRIEGLVHLWFKDCYEYHPVGFGYELLPGDVERNTNCVHAAAVELKSEGAADFWMIGDTVVPLDLFNNPTSQGGSGGTL